jgi:hypothetical protein
MKGLLSVTRRILFAAAFALAAVATCEKVANLMGRTLVFIGRSSPTHLLELASVVLLFVIALELRAIKETWRGPGSSA